jgi:hypothetical protein
MRARLREDLDDVIPGEDWVVDGFHDAIAQDLGGIACSRTRHQ